MSYIGTVANYNRSSTSNAYQYIEIVCCYVVSIIAAAHHSYMTLVSHGQTLSTQVLINWRLHDCIID